MNEQIKILSQNLRFRDDPNGNSIEERSERFLKLVTQYKPDIIGTQETTKTWMDYLDTKLGKEYAMIGCSRNGRNAVEGEWNTVLYRKDRFELLNGNTFWLSETPEVEATKLDYRGCLRICTWTLLKDKVTGKEFMFNNTHLQNSAPQAAVREAQMNILVKHLSDDLGYMKKYPSFMTGDFNAESDEPAYAIITSVLNDARVSCEKDLSAVNYTFHNYGKAQLTIDYCFHSPKTTSVKEYKILDDKYDGYVSDHYGILVTAEINDRK